MVLAVHGHRNLSAEPGSIGACKPGSEGIGAERSGIRLIDGGHIAALVGRPVQIGPRCEGAVRPEIFGGQSVGANADGSRRSRVAVGANRAAAQRKTWVGDNQQVSGGGAPDPAAGTIDHRLKVESRGVGRGGKERFQRCVHA